MIEFKNLINKSSKSFELACKCARSKNIYAESVLKANRFNLNFLHHLRSLEVDVCRELVLNAIVRAGDISPCTIHIVSTNNIDILKVMANADLDSALEALDCDYYTKRAFKLSNGDYKYIYEVKFNLTL